MPTYSRGSFTIKIPDQINPATAYSERDIIGNEQMLINNIEQNAKYLLETLQGQYDSSTITPADIDEELVYELSFSEAIEYMKTHLLGWVLNYVDRAAYSTVEYNHYLYIERLEREVNRKISDLVTFRAYGGGIRRLRFTAHFEKLGRIDEWARAVKKVREQLGTSNLDAEIRSRFWREKIYGTAREGVTITKKYKGKKGEEGRTEDITDRYAGKYEETIQARLTLVKDAPFWYLIDKGNSIGMSSDIGGEAYPEVAPTNFSDQLDAYLGAQFYTALDSLDDVVRKYIADIYNEWSDRKRVVEEYEYRLEDMEIALKVYEDLTKLVTYGDEQIFFKSTTKKIGKIEASYIPELNIRVEEYRKISSRGKLTTQKSYRSPITGRYVSQG